MKKYHKIHTIYKRDPKTKNRNLLMGEYSKPEFEFLKNLIWVATEKIDGTNIRVIWDGKNVEFAGKTDNASIPAFLVNHLKNTFTNEKMEKIFPKEKLEDGVKVTLYGEGYGARIQKGGGNYISDGVSFILFDIKIGFYWLTRDSIEDLAKDLDIPIVPIIGYMTLNEAIKFVRNGFYSTIAEKKDFIAEGLILKPKFELFDRAGRRIITKIKHKDFKKVK